MASSDWNWQGATEKGSTIVENVEAVAIYTNPTGNIVIRQQNSMGDEDAVIIIPRASVNAIVKALKAEAAKKFEPDLSK